MANSIRLSDLAKLEDAERKLVISEFLASAQTARPRPAVRCPECGKWFSETPGKPSRCPDEQDHARLGVKCCHWGKVETKSAEKDGP